MIFASERVSFVPVRQSQFGKELFLVGGGQNCHGADSLGRYRLSGWPTDQIVDLWK
ncbi:MAG: hypothetical protein R3C05_13365 [Pirellulaceae bacterium]